MKDNSEKMKQLEIRLKWNFKLTKKERRLVLTVILGGLVFLVRKMILGI